MLDENVFLNYRAFWRNGYDFLYIISFLILRDKNKKAPKGGAFKNIY